MGRADYEGVLQRMRLADGTLWPIPITLPVGAEEDAHVGEDVCLLDSRSEPLAIMTLEEVYCWDLATEAQALLGRVDTRHPLVSEMLGWAPRYASGTLRVVTPPRHYDFTGLRLTPGAVRERLEAMGREAVVAFQTRNPLHRSHEELTKKALRDVSGTLLLHPTIGLTKAGYVDAYTRVRTYEEVVKRYYDPRTTLLALVPLAMRMAGPREALWHALVRRNYGASHFIVGRDRAGPGAGSSGEPFFEPYAAQELVAAHAEETGVQPLAYGELVYLPREDRYEEISRVPAGSPTLSISGTSTRDEYLAKGRLLPEWFTRPEAAKLLLVTNRASACGSQACLPRASRRSPRR